MSILEELKKYAHECINDVIVSGKKHKWACERFLKDLENPKFYWDEEEAQRIYKWFTYLRHSKGELAKQPIILTTWQKFVMCQIHAWRRQEDGLRRFKQAFIIVCCMKYQLWRLETEKLRKRIAQGRKKTNRFYYLKSVKIC